MRNNLTMSLSIWGRDWTQGDTVPKMSCRSTHFNTVSTPHLTGLGTPHLAKLWPGVSTLQEEEYIFRVGGRRYGASPGLLRSSDSDTQPASCVRRFSLSSEGHGMVDILRYMP